MVCLVTLTDLQMRHAGLSASAELLVKNDMNRIPDPEFRYLWDYLHILSVGGIALKLCTDKIFLVACS